LIRLSGSPPPSPSAGPARPTPYFVFFWCPLLRCCPAPSVYIDSFNFPPPSFPPFCQRPLQTAFSMRLYHSLTCVASLPLGHAVRSSVCLTSLRSTHEFPLIPTELFPRGLPSSHPCPLLIPTERSIYFPTCSMPKRLPPSLCTCPRLFSTVLAIFARFPPPFPSLGDLSHQLSPRIFIVIALYPPRSNACLCPMI